MVPMPASTPTSSRLATCSSSHVPLPPQAFSHAQAKCPCPHQAFPGHQKVLSLNAHSVLLLGGTAAPERRERVSFSVTPQAWPVQSARRGLHGYN